ncbi:MAG: hypothetical protein ABI726_08320 [bacterium]
MPVSISAVEEATATTGSALGDERIKASDVGLGARFFEDTRKVLG